MIVTNQQIVVQAVRNALMLVQLSHVMKQKPPIIYYLELQHNVMLEPKDLVDVISAPLKMILLIM